MVRATQGTLRYTHARFRIPCGWSCSALAGLTSVAFTIIVSKVTRPLPETHVRELFENV